MTKGTTVTHELGKNLSDRGSKVQSVAQFTKKLDEKQRVGVFKRPSSFPVLISKLTRFKLPGAAVPTTEISETEKETTSCVSTQFMGNIVVLSVRRFRPKLKRSKPYHVVMVGLDRSGKTSILYRSKLREHINAVPTTAFNVETVRPSKGLKFKIWDVGGRDQNRPLWKAYVRQTDAIIFVVDCANETRMEEAREELFNLVNSAQINGAPILVLANKQDKLNAIGPMELINKLSLHSLNMRHLWFVQPTSAKIGEGIYEGLRTLADMIDQWREDMKFQKTKSRKNQHSLATSRTNSAHTIL